jgi:hypothetical protein
MWFHFQFTFRIGWKHRLVDPLMALQQLMPLGPRYDLDEQTSVSVKLP